MKPIREYSEIIRNTVGLASLPVGVTFVDPMGTDGHSKNEH